MAVKISFGPEDDMDDGVYEEIDLESELDELDDEDFFDEDDDIDVDEDSYYDEDEDSFEEDKSEARKDLWSHVEWDKD